MSLVRSGRLAEALAAAEGAVRSNPTHAGHRISLAEVCLVLGDWERARVHAGVAGDLEATHQVFVDLVDACGACEVVRAGVLSGKLTPMIFGEPESWMARQVELCMAIGQGAADRVAGLASEAGPTVRARIDGVVAEGLADSDSRLGMMLEAFVGGRYYWVPMTRVGAVVLEKPSSLWNLAWTTVVMKLTNGGEVPCVMPVRYPFVGADAPERLLARVTEWSPGAGGAWIGHGQRTWLGGDAQFGMLDARRLEFLGAAGDSGEGGRGNGG
jgi:type VI secretion system protein ImpE